VTFTQVSYFAASFLFLLGLRGLTHPETARRGTMFAALGMLVAVVGTLAQEHMSCGYIAAGLVIGTIIGIPMGLKIPMTKMPERIALSHSFGGLAVALVGVVEFIEGHAQHGGFHMGATGFEVLLGALTFTGSIMAFGKLQGILPGKPSTFPFQNFITVGALIVALAAVVYMVVAVPDVSGWVFYPMFGLALMLGVLLVLPIGGADMPVVICLLNSYAGLAAAASGFVFNNPVLIICGALDGGSGFILAMLMSKAMNRSFANVLFGAFGSDGKAAAAGPAKAGAQVNEATVEEAAEVLKSAGSVIVVPGYGMAVAQAQHAVRDLANLLEKNGARVRYAIHPVAGRMPGHMNVLLAEANIPYEQLFDLDQINDDFSSTDAVLVVGANDVVNPAAKNSPGSPIFGMPVFNCDQARAVFVLKRSMNPGFAGIENELFIHPKTMMVFGDAKATLTKMCAAMKEGH
jgi:NAD(P) transhydrogenase subunit beta